MVLGAGRWLFLESASRSSSTYTTILKKVKEPLTFRMPTDGMNKTQGGRDHSSAWGNQGSHGRNLFKSTTRRASLPLHKNPCAERAISTAKRRLFPGHHLPELGEERRRIVRSVRGFRVILNAGDFPGPVPKARVRA